LKRFKPLVMTMSRFTLLLVGIVLSVFGRADEHAHLPLYLDYPAGKWDDWSWATRDMRNTSPVHSHQYSIRAYLLPWTAIRFHHSEGFNTTGFSHLEFWVHGGSTGGQQFSIMAAVNGIDRPHVPITNYISSIPANQWVRVQVPLAHLGVASGDRLTDIYFIERRGQTVPTFYLDDIRLIRASVPSSATLTVDMRQTRRTLTPLHFGINVAAWDWELASTSTVNMMRRARFLALRYPGGSISNEYDWRNNRNRRDGTTYGTNTDQFLNVANQLGAEKIITVNYGSGTPEEARDWVQYANITRGGNVRYWIIGNECFGSWEYDTHTFQHDADTYARFTRDAIQLMKAVDPTIKVGVVGTWSETDFPQRFSVTNPRTGRVVNGWSAVLLTRLRELNVTPDFYDLHYYPQNRGHEDDANLLHYARDWVEIIGRTRQMLRDYLGTAGDNVQIMITENNSVSTNPGKQTTSLINALYLADSWGQACTTGADSFVWWDLHNSTETAGNNSPVLYGWRNWGDYGVLSAGPASGVGDPLNTPYPAFHAFDLLRRFASPGDTLVQASSTHPLVSLYAVKSASNGRARLLIINKARTLTIRADIRLLNAPAAREAILHQYGILHDQQRKSPTTRKIQVRGTTLRLELPPLSLTVLQITR
jgi:alpha-N-arabinofuranosidase